MKKQQTTLTTELTVTVNVSQLKELLDMLVKDVAISPTPPTPPTPLTPPTLKLKPADNEPQLSLQELRDKLKQAYLDLGGATVKQLFADFEIENLSGLDKSMYGEFDQCIDALRKEAK